jgi:tetratricopeptide (TPR) repeat protein
MLSYLGKVVWTCPLRGSNSEGPDRVLLPVRAFLAFTRQAARRWPRLAALLAVVLLTAGVATGLHLTALNRCQAAQREIKDGRAAEARADLDFCLRVWPRSARTHLMAARAARLNGDLKAAEAHLNRCLQLENGATEDTQLEFLLMRVQTGEADQVGEQLMHYVDNKHPDSELILETLARAYMHNLRYRPALAALDRWLDLAPDTPKALFWHGWMMERLTADHDKPMHDYLRALELDPDMFDVRLRVAELYLEWHNPPAALPHLEYLWRKHADNPRVKAALGRCRFMEGKSDEARPLLEAAVKELPTDAPLVITLAKLHNQMGQPVEAERCLRQLNDGYDLEGRTTLIESLRLQGREQERAEEQERYEKDRALVRHGDELLRSEVDHPTTGPKVPYEIGTIFLQIGQDRLGLNWLHQALDRDPGHQPSHKALAEYYDKHGEKEKADAHRRRLTGD